MNFGEQLKKRQRCVTHPQRMLTTLPSCQQIVDKGSLIVHNSTLHAKPEELSVSDEASSVIMPVPKKRLCDFSPRADLAAQVHRSQNALCSSIIITVETDDSTILYMILLTHSITIMS